MNKLNTLLDCVELLYRESELLGDIGESTSLVKNVLSTFQEEKFTYLESDENDPVENLKFSTQQMLSHNFNGSMDKEIVDRELSVIFQNDDYLKELIKNLTNKLEDRKNIINRVKVLRNKLITLTSEIRFSQLINGVNYKLRKDRKSIPDIKLLMSETAETINEMSITGTDEAILNVISFDDDKSMDDAIDTYKDESDGRSKFITGWQDLNIATQGGLRRGEFIVPSAIQHGYKTAFTLSLFAQMVELNDPKNLMTESEIIKKKKPLAIWVSFEDKESDKMAELFRYLYYDEHGVGADLNTFTTKEIRDYIKKRLTRTGFEIKILRVNPSDWTYKNIFSMFAEFEADGYVVLLAGLDYLSHVPTAGCISTGPMGTDLRDLFRRTKNHIMSKNICLLTPHQLATSVLELKRNGITDTELLEEIVDKGHYEKSRQLGQEIDVEIHLNIVKGKEKSHLHVMVGKHRLPTVINRDLKQFFLPFPPVDRIPSDIDKKKMSVRKIKDSDEFNF